MKIDALLTTCYQASLSMMMPYQTGDRIDVDSHYKIETKSRKVDRSLKYDGEDDFFSFLGYGVIVGDDLLSFSTKFTLNSNSYIFTDANVERQINNIQERHSSRVRFVSLPIFCNHVKYKNS